MYLLFVSLIFYILCIVSNCYIQVPSIESNLIISSRKCLLEITKKYFVDRPVVSIYTSNVSRDSSILKDIYQSGKHVKKLLNFTTYKTNFNSVNKKYAIVIGESLLDFKENHKQFEQLNLWNARAKYIFYFFTNNENIIEEFCQKLWYYYFINAIVIMPSVDNEDIINIFSWYPYEKNCGTDFPVELIDTCQHGYFEKNVNLFPNKVPNNLRGCPVRIRVLIWEPFVLPPGNEKVEDNKILNITEGIEVEMVKTISHIANFTILFSSSSVPHDWGLATFDGNTTGTIRALKYKEADIGMGAFGPTTERRMYCDYSACHMQEQVTWCIPRAQLAPRWRNLLEPFQMTAWLSMIITYGIVSLIAYLISICRPRDLSSYVKPKNVFLYTYSLFLAISANETPKKISGRIMLFVWIIFGLHFSVAYQAKLMGVLLKPSYEKQISSVEEVLKTGMKYALLPTHKRFYANVDDWRVEKIIREWTDCHDSNSCLHRVAYKRDFALCTLKAHAYFESLKYLDADGNSLVYCIPYLTYPSELYTTKGYPLKDRIDELIYRIKNTGLMFKWQLDIERKWYRKYLYSNLKSAKEQVLTISHMQGAFAIWIIGILLAVLIFLVEVVYFTLKASNLNRKEKVTKYQSK